MGALLFSDHCEVAVAVGVGQQVAFLPILDLAMVVVQASRPLLHQQLQPVDMACLYGERMDIACSKGHPLTVSCLLVVL